MWEGNGVEWSYWLSDRDSSKSELDLELSERKMERKDDNSPNYDPVSLSEFSGRNSHRVLFNILVGRIKEAYMPT